MTLLGRMQKLSFGISSNEATFSRRGFPPAEAAIQSHLERAAQTFVLGYDLALSETRIDSLAAELRDVKLEFQGFAFEGAAMGLALLDEVARWRRDRWRTFLNGAGDAHAYMVHVGAGWAAARLPWARRHILRYTAGMDPLLRWLVVDGYGFHQGFFYWRKSVQQREVPTRLTDYARRAFDQGLGRSLWFVFGADGDRIGSAVNAFPTERRADLYSGIGLACAYAGGADRESVRRLRVTSGPYGPNLAQGAAFAAKARLRAGNLMAHTKIACEILCDTPAEIAAGVTDQCLDNLSADGTEPAFEQWRQRIQSRMPDSSTRGSETQ